MLELPAVAGGTVAVHPVTLHSPLNGLAELSEYRIAHRDGELRIEAVLNGGEERRTCAEVESRLAAALARHGAKTPPIRVASVGAIPRHPDSGKHRAVEACD